LALHLTSVISRTKTLVKLHYTYSLLTLIQTCTKIHTLLNIFAPTNDTAFKFYALEY